jgi:hypothetical protein
MVWGNLCGSVDGSWEADIGLAVVKVVLDMVAAAAKDSSRRVGRCCGAGTKAVLSKVRHGGGPIGRRVQLATRLRRHWRNVVVVDQDHAMVTNPDCIMLHQPKSATTAAPTSAAPPLRCLQPVGMLLSFRLTVAPLGWLVVDCG